NMAAGKKGSKYMKFLPKVVLDAVFSNPNEVEAAKAYARTWLETDQWDQEVGNLIREIAKKGGWKEWTDTFHYNIFKPLSNAWVKGYVDYILELRKKEKLKKQKVEV
ncbi:MAG: hypothetical protein ACP5RX_03335, partial [Minisyncoccia bacterium]